MSRGCLGFVSRETRQASFRDAQRAVGGKFDVEWIPFIGGELDRMYRMLGIAGCFHHCAEERDETGPRRLNR